MAREYAKVKAGIWQDDDFRALPIHAQHLYFVILTDPELSYCGVTDWRPKRILPRAAGWDMETLEAAAAILVDRRLLVVDVDTEEVLVKSFLRHDGVMMHNKLCVSAMNSYAAVASNLLRGVIVHELQRLSREFPEWPTWERVQVKDVLKRTPIDPRSPDLGNPFECALGAGLASQLAPGLGANPNTGLGMPYNNNNNGNITTTTYGEPSPPKTPRKKTANAIPDDWHPTSEHEAKANDLGINVQHEAQKFVAHARANDRRLVNWNQAFTQWLLKASEYTTRSPNGGGFSRPSIDRQGDLLKQERARILEEMNQQPRLEINP
ncbi:hypothetical protein [Timonella senegalensis]|uniref:hypothetical protein n=1 Tax=Timonella senegalensis TaxID=1465825 RepID=UPI002FDED56D